MTGKTTTGICTGGQSTQILAAEESGSFGAIWGRNYLLVMNTGDTNRLHISIGSSNNAVISDLTVGPGESLVLTQQAHVPCPGFDISGFAEPGDTSFATLIY
jgi:hypothetical protein